MVTLPDVTDGDHMEVRESDSEVSGTCICGDHICQLASDREKASRPDGIGSPARSRPTLGRSVKFVVVVARHISYASQNIVQNVFCVIDLLIVRK